MNKSFIMKSIIFLFITIALLVTFVSCDELSAFLDKLAEDSSSEQAEEPVEEPAEEPDVESGNFRVSNKGELSVIDLSSVPAEVTVPSELEGRKVTVIAKDAFKGCQTVVNVKIENGIQTIGESAFASCPALMRIEIPESVTSIEDLAFSDCNILYDVIVPESLSSLPLSVFDGTIGAQLYNGSLMNAGVYGQIYADDFNNDVIVGSNTTPVLVKLGAYWCGPCKKMDLILPEVASYFDGAVSVYTVDIDDEFEENPDLMDELVNNYQIMNIPALFLFIDGEIVWKSVGLKEKDRLINIIEEQLQKAGK